MKKPRTLTRTAASLLMLPILYLAVVGLLYGALVISLSEPVNTWLYHMGWMFFLSEAIYVILICMAFVSPFVVLASSAVGIILQIRGIRKGENKKKGLWIIASFVLLILLLIGSFFAYVLYMNSTGGFAS